MTAPQARSDLAADDRGASGTRVSAVVLAQDVEGTIARCLRSLAFADEAVVVDGGSVDGTVEIAGSLGARVVSNPWPGFAQQRRVSLREARHDWVFVCDSDEEVPPALAEEIRRAVGEADHRARAGGPAPMGFRVRRRNQFLGGWMDVGPWAHDFALRLVRRDAARVTEASVHEGIEVDGEVRTLVQPLFHYTHATVSDSVRRLNRYTSLEARDRVGRRRVRLLDAIIPPGGVFLKYYLVKGCWRAGTRGLLLAAITAMYKSVLYSKLYLLQRGTVPRG